MMRAMEVKHLKTLFHALLAARFMYPFYQNPMNSLYSDPQRHWNNADSLFSPTFDRGMDMTGYQVFLYFIRYATDDSPFGIAFVSGVLCVLLPWLWSRIAREMFRDERFALLCGICVGIMPSLLFIYAFTMVETLLLNVVAAGILLSLIYLREKSASVFLYQTAMLTFAALTKFAAVPVSVMFLGFSIWRANPGAKILLTASVIAALMINAAGVRSAISAHFFSPFGILDFARIYSKSDAKKIVIRYNNGAEWYQSPALEHIPLAPLSGWKSKRSGEVEIQIDLLKGREDWTREIARFPVKPENYLRQIEENFIIFFFDFSWPEHMLGGIQGPLIFASRWVWFPLTVFIVCGLAGYRPQEYRRKDGKWHRHWLQGEEAAQTFFVLLTLAVVGAMLVQYTGIMEGRYRKPVEPLLIMSAFIVVRKRFFPPRKTAPKQTTRKRKTNAPSS